MKGGAHRDHTTISIRDVLKTMALEPIWMWVDMHGTPITTVIPADIKARRLEKYLKRRDEYRADRGGASDLGGNQSNLCGATVSA